MCRALWQIRREILDTNAKLAIMAQELRSALSTLETSARVQKNRKYVRPIAIVFIVDTHQQMHARGNTLTSPPPPAIFASVWTMNVELK